MTTDATNTLIGMVPTVAAVGVVDSATRIGRLRSQSRRQIVKRKPRVEIFYAAKGKYVIVGKSKKDVMRKREDTVDALNGIHLDYPKISRQKSAWNRW